MTIRGAITLEIAQILSSTVAQKLCQAPPGGWMIDRATGAD